MSRASRYLTILDSIAVPLEGLHWSDTCDAIEHAGGKTFALAGQVQAFVEGLASRRPLFHFNHVLHFLHLLRGGPPLATSHDFTPLVKAWRDVGRPARTSGVLAGVLASDLAFVMTQPAPEELRAHLALGVRDDEMGTEEPTASLKDFEDLLHRSLEQHDSPTLVHWLRHAQPPLPPQAIPLAAEALHLRPRSLSDLLTEVARHKRLAGALPHVDRLVGALTLPPDRLRNPELPVGGYSDVTMRGQPEQLLPSQFALDEEEFLRRHAQNELLYFRREDPAQHQCEQLVVLIDQGVRTWGRVRLLLAGVVLALARLCDQRRHRLLLASTGNAGQPIDPLKLPVARLEEMLAGSDLSLSPGDALSGLLTCLEESACDILLLTHPRCLTEPEVKSPGSELVAGQRLFAVTVDAGGSVRHVQLIRGQPVALGGCQLDLSLSVPGSEQTPGCATSWQGEIEPVPFPFRFGPPAYHSGLKFDFDYTGDWLVNLTNQGMLFAMRTDGEAYEVLPRPCFAGQLLTDLREIVPVSGGIVVLGSHSTELVAVHYLFSARQTRLYRTRLPAGNTATEWRYLRHQQALVIQVDGCFAWIHLPSGNQSSDVPDHLRWSPTPSERPNASPMKYHLPVQEGGVPRNAGSSWREPILTFNCSTGVIQVEDAVPGWKPFRPLADGKPLLVGQTLERAVCRSNTLVANFVAQDGQRHLYVFAGPEGQLSGTLPQRAALPWALSSDGEQIAIANASVISIRPTRSLSEVGVNTFAGRFHNNAVVDLGVGWLALTIGQHVHGICWATGMLEHVHYEGGLADLHRHLPILASTSTSVRAGREPWPEFLPADRTRFRAFAYSGLIACLSQFGEVFLFAPDGHLLAGFFTLRNLIAGWLAEGGWYGSSALTGHTASADAPARFGKVLLEASQLPVGR